MTAYFSSEIMQPRILYCEKISFRSKGRIKTFSEIHNLKIFIISTPALEKTIKSFRQRENNTRGKYGSTWKSD